MKSQLIRLFLIMLLGFLFLVPSCSGGKSPVEPETTGTPTSFDPSENNERNIIGVWRAEINPDDETFTIESVFRNETYHFPLNSYFPNVLSITGYGWTPNFWADIRLSHPFPGSGIDAFDPRVIAILPANPDVSMDYPILDVHANNSVLVDPDGYTKLWDDPGYPGNDMSPWCSRRIESGGRKDVPSEPADRGPRPARSRRGPWRRVRWSGWPRR